MKRLLLLAIIFISSLSAKIESVVSILPQKSFTEAIGGDKVNVSVMVPPGLEPHTYEPKPSQMRKISKASLYFALNLPFEESWLPKLKNQNSKMEIINVAKGIKKEHLDKDGHSLDPHIWTSPENIKIIAKNIYTALAAKDKENSSYYKQNYEKFLEKVNAVDKEIKSILANTPKGSKFLVFHPAWGYFAKEYGLEQIAIEANGQEPKPKQLIALIKEAKKYKVKAVFTEPEFSQKAAKQIANALKVPVIAVSPLNPNWSQTLVKLAKAIANSE